MKEMGLHAADAEKSVFSGEYEFRGKKVWMLLLAYVDDLMIACRDREAALNLIERLGLQIQSSLRGVWWHKEAIAHAPRLEKDVG